MPALPDRARLSEIWRYYQAGVLNTLFGYGMFALLVRLGLDLYLAQLVAHVAGMAFNYLSYSRHVFRGSGPAKARFILSYVGNYLLGLATLWTAARLVHSPYAAGLLSIVFVSLINYFVLKHLVFVRKLA